MKKANLYILIGSSIFFLFIFILKPLSGSLFLKMDNTGKEVPADPLSKFVMNFSKEVTAKPISLKSIEHIIINAEGKPNGMFPDAKTWTFNLYSDTVSSIQFIANSYLQDVPHVVNGNSLTITLTPDMQSVGEIYLDTAGIKSIQFNKINGYIRYQNLEVQPAPIKLMIFDQQSDMDFNGGYSRETTVIQKDMNLLIKNQSKVKIDGIEVDDMHAELDNGFLDLSFIKRINNLQGVLNGKSHIMGAKKMQGKEIQQVHITGNLDYYNSH